MTEPSSGPPPLPETRDRESLLAWREEYRAWRERTNREQAEAEAAEREAAEEALRQPPARAWRIGHWIGWEPPAKGQPDRYQIYTPRASIHDGPLGTTSREYHGRLTGSEPVKVAACYGGQGDVSSPWLHQTPGEHPYIVSRVRYYCTETQRGQEHVDRWRRVLAAFGVSETKRGHASRPPVSPLDPPMMIEEAQGYADRGWKRWYPVVLVLRRLAAEGIGGAKVPPASRETKIDAAVQSFTGRRTRSGKPYVRDLEKALGFDITARERDAAWRRASGS